MVTGRLLICVQAIIIEKKLAVIGNQESRQDWGCPGFGKAILNSCGFLAAPDPRGRLGAMTLGGNNWLQISSADALRRFWSEQSYRLWEIYFLPLFIFWGGTGIGF